MKLIAEYEILCYDLQARGERVNLNKKLKAIGKRITQLVNEDCTIEDINPVGGFEHNSEVFFHIKVWK